MNITAMWRALFALSLLLFAAGLAAAELQVSAAASLSDALQEIGAAYEREHATRVRFNFGASSTLAMQIREGAPVDVFVSADEAQMDTLERAGLLARGSRHAILSNVLVIVVPAESSLAIRDAAALALPPVRRIALANPESVPAGVYAKQYLQRRALWSQIAGKVIPTENVRGALAAVESENVDAAIVYRSDAAISRRARVAAVIDGRDAPAISYPAAVLAQSGSQRAASAFVNYLTSDSARQIFQRYGFVVK